MKYNPEKHDRRSLRLQGYNYSSAGLYFVTICTYQRQCLLGEIVQCEMRLSEYGKIVSDEWLRSREIREEIDFDAWVIMPKHIHGIVIINPPDIPQSIVGANGRSPLQNVASQPANQNPMIPPMKPRSLSSLVAGFKSATTKQINILRNAPETPVWQRNYYEHIIRNDASLQLIRQYIHNNPLSWQEDHLHPDCPSKW
jgi:REP element-mobilizing transposase RayT